MIKKSLAVLLAVVMVLASFPMFAFATTETEKPADGTTQGQPFVSGNPSQNYRIPCLVTMNDGTLVAAADARWDSTADGGGNDTIVSRSADNGATWNYTMANYYGDNGNVHNSASTAFCDSELATDGETVYMLSLFFPAGISITAGSTKPAEAAAFDGNGRLLLGQGSSTNYNYYLGEFDSTGFARIYSSSGSVVSDYTVDREYYIYKNGVKEGSVFYSDAAYQTVKTSFLFFRSSIDNGKTWSSPTLVTSKRSDESFYGVGPGRGLVIDNPSGAGKRILFSCYHWENRTINANNYQRSSFIYSDDGGKTWKRTEDATAGSSGTTWSSENQLVELDDGTIRMFYRNGNSQICYIDYTWNGSTYVKGTSVQTGAGNQSNCQISAIKYPYKIDGKQAILVSCPRDTGARTTGCIYGLLLNDDNTVSEVTKYNITDNGAAYAYSCLSVLDNGKLGILYEGENSVINFVVKDVATLTGKQVETPSKYDITLLTGVEKTYTVSTDAYNNSNPDVVGVAMASAGDGSYSMTLRGIMPGSSKITVNDVIFNVVVVEDNTVTGAVSYDPVIYTHGSNYMMVGNNIADASETGEKSTAYTVAAGYTIQSITCLEYASNISFSDGKLHGTLDAQTNATVTYNSGETVTLKTELSGPDGNTYVQYDKVFVATNPVAAHAVASQFTWKGAYPYVTIMPVIFTLNGSYGDVNNGYPGIGNNGLFNAKDLYTANALKYIRDTETMTTNDILTNTVDKKVGCVNNNKSGSTGGNQAGSFSLEPSNPAGYYYYDMSSDKNQGITRTSADGSTFTLNLGMTPIATEKEVKTIFFSDVTVLKDDTEVQFNSSSYDSISGAGLQCASLKTVFDNYTLNQGGTQTLSVQGTVTSEIKDAGKFTATARTIAKTQFDSGLTSQVDVHLPFEIIVCDKSAVRTAYNTATAQVRKSSDYTTSSWAEYISALHNAETFLSNYTQTADDTGNLDSALSEKYNALTKRADFSRLDQALSDKSEVYKNGFVVQNGKNVYTVDSWLAFLAAYQSGSDIVTEHSTASNRADTAGYTAGPDSDNGEPLQNRIDETVANINKGLDTAADDEPYVQAKAIASTIDKTAYKDNGAKLDEAVANGDQDIYKEYNGTAYINADQDVIDVCTTQLLTAMNLGSEDSLGRTFHVNYQIDGSAAKTVENKTDYVYGSVAHVDLTQYNTEDYIVKCKVNSANDTTKTPTIVNLANCGYYLSLLIQEDLEITVETIEKPSITIVDYYGTVLGAFKGNSVTVNGDTITVGSQSVKAKPSPKYNFTGWTLSDGAHSVDKPIIICQKGTQVAGAADFTAVNGLVNNEANFTSSVINTKLDLTAESDAKYWTRTVNDTTYLASYEQNFVNFSSLEDVTYTAYSSASDLPANLQEQVNNNIPATYGTGIFSNDKFTLSCDYSAPENVEILEVGIIYSTTENKKDTLVKGNDNAKVITTNNVAHWGSSNQSGTYTMTKVGSGTGTHYMRSYVSYTLKYKDYSIPYVVYGETIYQCADGVVSQVTA